MMVVTAGGAVTPSMPASPEVALEKRWLSVLEEFDGLVLATFAPVVTPREASTPVLPSVNSRPRTPVSSLVSTRRFSVGLVESRVAETPEALVPLLTALILSRIATRESVPTISTLRPLTWNSPARPSWADVLEIAPPLTLSAFAMLSTSTL